MNRLAIYHARGARVLFADLILNLALVGAVLAACVEAAASLGGF